MDTHRLQVSVVVVVVVVVVVIVVVVVVVIHRLQGNSATRRNAITMQADDLPRRSHRITSKNHPPCRSRKCRVTCVTNQRCFLPNCLHLKLFDQHTDCLSFWNLHYGLTFNSNLLHFTNSGNNSLRFLRHLRLKKVNLNHVCRYVKFRKLSF